MKRGQLWTVAESGDYTGKPRPVLIVQDDHFDATDSVTICGLTTLVTEAAFFRVEVPANPATGLRTVSHVMVDKITTVRRARLGTQIGALETRTMLEVNRAIALFLGLATPAARPRR